MRVSPFVIGLVCCATASPTPILDRRTAAVADTTLFDALANGANDPHLADSDTSNVLSTIVSLLQQIDLIASPDSPEAALSALKHTLSNDGVLSVLDVASKITEAGLVPPEILSFLNGYFDSELNSVHNQNPPPRANIYPSKSNQDAPYSLPEETLRSAIHIPPSFNYGRNGKTPVILVPGTAIPAGSTYHFSFSKLGNSTPVDVVWVNIPHASLSDAQVNAEYVAYAINYISTLCANKDVAVISWSQGGLDTQWALKYWPSTRSSVQDFIALSPDFHGTIEEAVVCPALTFVACTPSIWQQAWEADFIRTLRSDGGDQAYVPTTIVYSSFDEIVQPMSGPSASALLGDARGAGVTSAQLQTVCAGQPAGGFYTHEGVLYNPLTWALAIDAIVHDGPASLSRLDLAQVCGQVLAPELELEDLFGTEGLFLVAGAEVVSYRPHATGEPPVRGYASNGNGSQS